MPNKTRPCPECGVTGRQSHYPSCATGQRRSAMSRAAHASRQANVKNAVTKRFNQSAPKASRRKTVPVTQAVAVPVSAQLVNHIALVMDGSGSMSSVYDLVIATINAQIDRIKMESQDKNQATYLTVFSFEDQVHLPIINNAFIHQVNHIRLDQFKRGGSTALFDAIGEAITRFERLGVAGDPNTSFLVVTVTDGQENASRRWSRSNLQAKIRQLQGTDRWTFAFSGPRGSGAEVQRQLDFYAGNVTEWENTRQGTQVMSNNLSAGVSTFYGARSRGLTSTKSFFTPDLSQVSARDLNKLRNVKDEFKVLPVDNSTADGREWEIRPFVEDRIAKNTTLNRQVGGQYEVGRAYYELTKPEDVQPHKDILVLDRTTGAIYGGPDARNVIGMPSNCDVKVKPGNVANYRLFIKSTSVNRKLVRGTAVLYRVR